MELHPVDPRDAGEIERAITVLAGRPNGGLIVTATNLAAMHRAEIIALAKRHRVPAVYPFRFFVAGGGLISYGPDTVDQYRRAAGYVDRILKGEKPADLPVQAPTSTTWSSTSRPPRHSASTYHPCCSPRRRGDRVTVNKSGRQNKRRL